MYRRFVSTLDCVNLLLVLAMDHLHGPLMVLTLCLMVLPALTNYRVQYMNGKYWFRIKEFCLLLILSIADEYA